MGVNGPFNEADVFLRFLYSFNETDFFGVVEASGRGGDFLAILEGGGSLGVLSSDGNRAESSRLRFCPTRAVDRAELAGEEDLCDDSNAPGRVGLRGWGISGGLSIQN